MRLALCVVLLASSDGSPPLPPEIPPGSTLGNWLVKVSMKYDSSIGFFDSTALSQALSPLSLESSEFVVTGSLAPAPPSPPFLPTGKPDTSSYELCKAPAAVLVEADVTMTNQDFYLYYLRQLGPDCSACVNVTNKEAAPIIL